MATYLYHLRLHCGFFCDGFDTSLHTDVVRGTIATVSQHGHVAVTCVLTCVFSATRSNHMCSHSRLPVVAHQRQSTNMEAMAARDYGLRPDVLS